MAVPKKKNSRINFKYSLLKKKIKQHLVKNIIFVKKIKQKLNNFIKK